MTAAAIAALRHLMKGRSCPAVAVRLPDSCFIPVKVRTSTLTDEGVEASVIKDGGDDPDVTHRAEISVKLRMFHSNRCSAGGSQQAEYSGPDSETGIYLYG